MSGYVVHHQRDADETPILLLEVDDASGKITKAARPDGSGGLPSSVGLLGGVIGTRSAPTLKRWQALNRGLVAVKKGAVKVEKSAYKLVTEQTNEEVGYILVDDETQTVEGYAGDTPPVGFIEGQTLSDFLAGNRGYKVEAVEQTVEEIPEEGDDVEIQTAPEPLNDAALVGIAVGHALQASGVISKADVEQQIVYGWAYVTHDKNGVVKDDKSGDFVDDVREIEKSAVDFMLHHRASDLDHTNVKGGEVIESMVFTPDKREAMGIPEGILPNGWWIGVKCNDEQWAGYKAGRTAFSIHGSGTRSKADD